MRYGITRYLAICLTNWKEYKSVPCALSFLATHSTKLSNWLITQDLATGEMKPVYSGVTRALIGGGGGGVYSYIRVLPDGFLLK